MKQILWRLRGIVYSWQIRWYEWKHETDLSAPLTKATWDQWQYRVILRNGWTYDFSQARVKGDWVDLDGVEGYERGISVRLSEIVAIADTGH